MPSPEGCSHEILTWKTQFKKEYCSHCDLNLREMLNHYILVDKIGCGNLIRKRAMRNDENLNSEYLLYTRHFANLFSPSSSILSCMIWFSFKDQNKSQRAMDNTHSKPHGSSLIWLAHCFIQKQTCKWLDDHSHRCRTNGQSQWDTDSSILPLFFCFRAFRD